MPCYRKQDRSAKSTSISPHPTSLPGGDQLEAAVAGEGAGVEAGEEAGAGVVVWAVAAAAAAGAGAEGVGFLALGARVALGAGFFAVGAAVLQPLHPQ